MKYNNHYMITFLLICFVIQFLYGLAPSTPKPIAKIPPPQPIAKNPPPPKRQDQVSTVELPLKPVNSSPFSNVLVNQDYEARQEEVSTIVQVPVTTTTSITYYYPYFYKAHLITFADEVDVTVLSATCSDSSCAYCDPHFSVKCMKCFTGYYLSGDVCVAFCPAGYISDVLRFKCVEVRSVATEVIYTMAYSYGSCKNMCGKVVQDCSCSPSCKLRGNCCTDYDTVNCDSLVAKNALMKSDDCKKSPNCDLCDDQLKVKDAPKCNQCKDNYFLYEGQCYQTCPEGTVPDSINYLCEKKPLCTVEHCDTCEAHYTDQCQFCKRGTFLYNKTCVEKCPEGYRADRITWTCLEPPVFAWYWVYPSRTSCKSYCGVVIQDGWDCSCSNDCYLFGNCCQDIEFYCPNIVFFYRKKANRVNNNLKKELPSK